MATIDNVFQRLKYKASKAGYVGTISPNDFNLIWPTNELKYYLKEFGNQNEYRYGDPVPRIAYPGTLKVSTSLSKFKSTPQTIAIDGTGKYTKPADCFFIDSISHLYQNGAIPTSIKRVEEQDLADTLFSYVNFPTELFPIYVEYPTYIQFYPANLGTGIFSYLKKPTTSLWNYTLNGTISTTNTLVGGSAYVNSTYPNVPLTGGAGNSAIATITVAGGAVTQVQIINGGFMYKTGDVLSASNTYLGGAGTGFSVTVGQITNARQVYNPTGSIDPIWADFDLEEIIYMTLSDIGINLRDTEVEGYASANMRTGGIG